MSPQLAQVAVRHPVRVLAVAAVLASAAAGGLPRLELRTDGRALVPASSPEVLADQEIRRRFGARDLIAVVVSTDRDEGVFHPAVLRRVRELTEALLLLEGVRSHDVVSLATERGFRRGPGVMAYRALLDPMPESREERDRLRDELDRIGLYRGTLVSDDGMATAVLLGVPPAADRTELVRAVERLAEAEGARGPGERESVEVLGAPAAEALLGRHVLADLELMVPIALALMGLVFLLAFRRPAAAMLPLAEIAVVLAVVFGLMGWLGVPVYLTTAVLPVILTAVGVADEIHVFRRYLDLGPSPRQSGAEHRRLVRAALDEMAPPVVATSVTTAVAFLSFALSPLAPVRTFGLFTALGVLLAMVCSLSVLPALMVLLGPGRLVRKGAAASLPGRGVAPRLALLARFASRRRRAVLAAAVLAVLVALDGVRRLEVQDSWTGGFDPGSAFARSTRSFERRFAGSHRLLVAVEVEAHRLSGEVPAASLGPYELRLAELPFDPVRLGGSWIRLFRLEGPAREWTTWIETAERRGGEVVVSLSERGGSARAWLHPEPEEEVGYEIWSEPHDPGTGSGLRDPLPRALPEGRRRGPGSLDRRHRDPDRRARRRRRFRRALLVPGARQRPARSPHDDERPRVSGGHVPPVAVPAREERETGELTRRQPGRPLRLSAGGAVFAVAEPNFGLLPPPEAAPYIGHFLVEIPLGVDVNGNGENDKIKFTLASHSVGGKNRQFIVLPDGTILDEFDSAAFLEGALVDESSDPPFEIGRRLPSDLPDPAAFGGPASATSSVSNPLPDADGDGVWDFHDQCPASDTGPTVAFGGCDSGVGNVLVEPGCTIADLIAGLAAGARNHGDFVSRVAHFLDDLANQGVISGSEKGSIQRCAARSGIGK